MMLSSAKIFCLMLLMIFCLHHLQPVGEYNIQDMIDKCLKAILKLDEGLQESGSVKECDDELEEMRPNVTIDNQVTIKDFTRVKEKLNECFQGPEPIKKDDESAKNLPLLMWHLTPALIEEARRELNETEEIKEKALVELRRMIEAEENLVSPTDDVFLLAFLRKYRFDVAKAFKRVQDYWIFTSDYEHIFTNLDRERVLSYLEKDTVVILMYRDRVGCTVFICKPGKWNPDEDLFEDAFLAIAGVLTYALEFEATQVAGYRVIVDLEGVGWRQLRFFTPSNIIFSIRAGMYTFPARFRRIHLLGKDRMIRFLWNIMYPFLPEELKKRLSFHSEDFQFLQEYIHPTVIPEEYGGLAPHAALPMDLVRENFDKVSKLVDYGYKK